MKKSNLIIGRIFLFTWIFIQCFSLLNNVAISFHHQKEKEKKANCVLNFSKDEWKKVNPFGNDELEINGKMFDANSILITKNNIKIIGHFDKKEDEIKSNINNFESEKSKIKQTSFFSFVFYENAFQYNFYKLFFLKKNHSSIYNQSLAIQYIRLDTPPPKMI